MSGCKLRGITAIVWLMIVLGVLAGCGQMGPLTLPDAAGDGGADNPDENDDERED